MPVCRIVKLLPLGTVDHLVHYCTQPSAKAIYPFNFFKVGGLKSINSIYSRLFCCNHTCYCVGMVAVTSASGYVTQRHVIKVDLLCTSESDSAEFHDIGRGESNWGSCMNDDV